MTDFGTVAETGEISRMNPSQEESAGGRGVPHAARAGETVGRDAIADGLITEVITFPPSVFEKFGLPSRIR